MPTLRNLAALTSRPFDVLVVGGGITGAGIARDAALRGLAVALVDKGDFASGTSSRSSRLVHGGVRYLEHGHLRLVFEASAERRILSRIAPHLVRPLAFTWPVYAGQRLPVWKLSAGLALYDALSLFRNFERHRRLRAKTVLAREPALARSGLRGGVRYFDAATDDTRLTLANVVDAVARGAVAANHAAVTRLVDGRDALTIAEVEDALTGERFDVRARIVVNAAGPWSDAVARLGGTTAAPGVQGSKGAHLAVSRERVGNTDALVLLHPRDGRVMFALPAGPHTIFGTTDTFTSTSPDDVRASRADVDYLLEAANAYFPDAALTRDDVVAAWAGIRPLMPSSGTSVSASREHLIRTHGRTITITGGKLTTFRVMARQVIDAAQRLLGGRPSRCRTAITPLPDDATAALDAASRQPGGEAPVVPGLPYRMGAMRHAAERELACTLGDLLIRRTHVAFETKDNGRAAARAVAEFVAPVLGWDATGRAREISRYEAEVARLFAIDD